MTKIKEMTLMSRQKFTGIAGLPLSRRAVRVLKDRGIFAHSLVSIEHQQLAQRYVVRGLESGGAAGDVGRYVTFAGDDGPDSAGRVCLGSMRVPEEVSVGSLSRWENAYFTSEFTHPSGAVRLTTHSGGFLGLWSHLAWRKHFLLELLADSKQTLQEFVERRGEG
jgi:E2/UBC family protein D